MINYTIDLSECVLVMNEDYWEVFIPESIKVESYTIYTLKNGKNKNYILFVRGEVNNIRRYVVFNEGDTVDSEDKVVNLKIMSMKEFKK